MTLVTGKATNTLDRLVTQLDIKQFLLSSLAGVIAVRRLTARRDKDLKFPIFIQATSLLIPETFEERPTREGKPLFTPFEITKGIYSLLRECTKSPIDIGQASTLYYDTERMEYRIRIDELPKEDWSR